MYINVNDIFEKISHIFVELPGLEPRMTGPKPAVLPLHHSSNVA